MPEDGHRSAAGETGSLPERLDRMREPAVRFAVRMLGDPHEAEDAVQDAFLGVLKDPKAFEGRSSPRTYVFAAVRNCCLDRRRARLTKSGRRREINPATTAFFRRLPQGSRFLGVSTQVQRREAREIVRAAVDALPDRQRDSVILHDLEGFTYREVAQIMETTTGNVGALLYSARARLRELIERGDFFSGD